MNHWFSNPKALLLTPLLVALVLVVACGSSAPAEPVVVEKQVIVEKEVIKEVPVEKQVVVEKEVVKEVVKEVPGKQVVKEVIKEVPGKEVVREVVKEKIVQVLVTAVPAQKTEAAEIAGRQGGFVNMMQYADVRQRLVHQSSVLNMNLNPLMNGLIEYNAESAEFTAIRCDICTGWDLSADGKTYTFRIHPDANWNDGVPVTAKDVVFAMESMVNPDQYPILEGRSTSSTVNAEVYYDSGNSREIDPKTVEITTKFPSGAFLAALATGTSAIQPYHTVIEQGILQGGRDLSAMNGSGPYKFVGEIKSVSVEYTKNRDYFKEGRPYLDGFKAFIITDPGRVIAAFKTEQILMSNSGSNLTPLEALKLDEEMDNLTVHWGAPGGYRGMDMNTAKAPFDDANVRQAVHLTMNRQHLIKSVSGGKYAMGYVLPEGLWFSRTAEEYANLPGYRQLNGKKHPDDLAEAKRLVTAAGVGNAKVTLSARNCCGYPDLAIQVKEQLQDALGWDITIKTMESGAGFDAYWAGDFQFNVQGHSNNYLDPDAIFTRFIRGTTPQWLGGGRGKFWTMPGMEDLYDRQKVEQDQAKRIALVHEMADIANVGGASIVLWWGVDFRPVNHKIKGYNLKRWNRSREHIWCDPAC